MIISLFFLTFLDAKLFALMVESLKIGTHTKRNIVSGGLRGAYIKVLYVACLSTTAISFCEFNSRCNGCLTVFACIS